MSFFRRAPGSVRHVPAGGGELFACGGQQAAVGEQVRSGAGKGLGHGQHGLLCLGSACDGGHLSRVPGRAAGGHLQVGMDGGEPETHVPDVGRARSAAQNRLLDLHAKGREVSGGAAGDGVVVLALGVEQPPAHGHGRPGRRCGGAGGFLYSVQQFQRALARQRPYLELGRGMSRDDVDRLPAVGDDAVDSSGLGHELAHGVDRDEQLDDRGQGTAPFMGHGGVRRHAPCTRSPAGSRRWRAARASSGRRGGT